MARHNHPARMFAGQGMCVACDKFWEQDSDEHLNQALSRVAVLESGLQALKFELQIEKVQHKRELDERDSALIEMSKEAINAQVDARIATDSEIRLRTNMERLLASTTGPIADRLRQVLDSYKEIPA
jgi:hypothetical protein